MSTQNAAAIIYTTVVLNIRKTPNVYITWVCGTAVGCGYKSPNKSSWELTASKSRARDKKSEEREGSIDGLVVCVEAIVKKLVKRFVGLLYTAQCTINSERSLRSGLLGKWMD
jgi:1,4-dihydroxy-2-naphthoyl-CoA synthase